MIQLRTHRPLRELFLGIVTRLVARPWGPWSTHLSRAVSEQEELGFGSVWYGFMVQRWGDIQESVYRERQEPKELTGGR